VFLFAHTIAALRAALRFADLRPGYADDHPNRRHNMNKDEASGRVKEAAGDLTGDKDLQREGKTEQAEGKAKEAVDSAADKVKDLVDRD
jgi:uncharacterized protein YjbJ (UPF0337 family)